MLKPEEKNILDDLHKKASSMSGICFALAMRNDDGSVEVYVRENQPCYGELRKYKKTHGEEATQPEGRPNDLHHPFPIGTPEALAIGLPEWITWRDGKIVPITNEPEVKEFFDFLLSDASPFVRGTGGTANVEWNEDGKGFVLLDLNIDPTVLVNLLKHIQCWAPGNSRDYRLFSEAKKFGLSEIQAFCLTYTVGYYYGKLNVPYHYVYPVIADLDRIVRQDPVDLTGGTLRDRKDYSRKRLHEVFYSKDGVNVAVEIAKKFGKNLDEHRGGIELEKDKLFEGFVAVWNDHFDKSEKKEAA